MLSLPSPFTSAPGGEATQPQWLQSPSAQPTREPLRHILVGSAAGVQQAIHTLHALNYVEPARWSRLLQVPSGGIVITPNQGAIMSYLIWERSRH